MSDFGSGHELTVDGFEPRVGLCACQHSAHFASPVSLSLCPSSAHYLSNKIKQNKIKVYILVCLSFLPFPSHRPTQVVFLKALFWSHGKGASVEHNSIVGPVSLLPLFLPPTKTPTIPCIERLLTRYRQAFNKRKILQSKHTCFPTRHKYL